ncbi:MAG: YfhO family protein [candidate division WOR-3 bacterium]
MKNKRYDILIIFSFTVLLFIFFWKIITKESFFWFDFILVEYPRRAYMAEMLLSGKIPLWLPYIYGGYPFIGSQPTFSLCPFLLFLSLFLKNNHISAYIVELSLLFQIWFGGITTYFLLKELGISKLSSLFGVVLFSFSLPTIVRTQHTGELTGLIWLPIIFYSLLKTSKERNLFWASISGLVIGMSILGSHIQVYFYLLGVVSSFLLYNTITSKERKKVLILAIVLILVSLFFAAPRIIPELEYVRLSSRTREFVAGYTPFKMILALFTPHIFGKGTDGYDYWGGYESFWMFVEYSSYIGVIGLLLLAFSYRIFNKKNIRFFFYLLGFALIFMYGKYNPFQKLIAIFLPGLRFHIRFMPFFVLASTIITSFSLDSLADNLKEKNFKKVGTFGLIGTAVIIAGVAVWHSTSIYPSTGLGFYKHKVIFQSLLLFGVFLLFSFSLLYIRSREKISSQWFKICASIILFFDLFLMGSYFAGQKMSPEDYYSSNHLIRFLQHESKFEKFRIDSPRFGYFYSNSRSLLFQLEALDGHVPNKLARFSKFEQAFKDQKEKYLDLYNVKYEVRDTTIGRNRLISLSKRDSYLPRAWIVHQVKKLADSLIIPYMKSNAFKPLEEMVVPEETKIVGFNKELKDKEKENVKIIEYEADKIKLEVELVSDGYLVLSEHYYPGWEAYINEERSDIICANYLFRAVSVPKGKHRVSFLFKPRSFYLGVALAFLSLIFTTVVFILSLIHYKKH